MEWIRNRFEVIEYTERNCVKDSSADLDLWEGLSRIREGLDAIFNTSRADPTPAGLWMGKSSEKAQVKHCLGDDKDHNIIGMAVNGKEEKSIPLGVVIQSGTDHHFLVLEGYLDLTAD
jgi:hypothetical protein